MKSKLAIFIIVLLLFIFTGVVVAEGGYIESGDDIEATLAPGTIDTWTFDASDGEKIIFGAYSDDFDSYVTLYDPNGVVIAEDDDSGYGNSALLWDVILEETGTYTVEVHGYSDEDSGIYFPLLYRILYSGEIEYSDTVQGTLSDSLVDGWEFYGFEGDRISINLSSDDFDTFLILTGPSVGIVIENDDYGDDSNSMIDSFVLPEDGYYTIEVSSYDFVELGDYELNLELLEENVDLIQTAVSGVELSGYLSAAYFSDWSFYAFEGETIDIALYSDEFDTYLEILDSEFNQLEYNDDGPDGTNSLIEGYTFPADGTYYISVSAYDPMEYGQYYLMLSESLGGELYMGEIMPGDSLVANLESGFWHGWEFIITDETYVTFSLQSDDFDAFLELYGPEGYLTDDDDGLSGTDAQILDYLLDVPGTYTVYASGYTSGETGEYILTFSTEGDTVTDYVRGPETQIPYNTIGEGYLEAGFYDPWLFTASAGDVVSIAVASDDIDPYIELYGPGDVLLEMNDDDGASFNSLIADFIIPDDGTYEVSVMGIDFTSTGAYTVLITTDIEQPPVVDVEEGINGLLEEVVIEYATKILEDGSGTFEVMFLIDDNDADEVIEQLEEREVGSGIDDWCDEVENIFDDRDELPNLDDGNYDEGDDSFSCSMVYEFDDFDELDEIYEAFGFVDVKDLDFDDENIEYNLDLEEVGAFVQALVSEDADIEFLWSVLVSGKLGENNADDVYDSKAVWEVDVDDSTELEMAAEKGGIPMIFILGGAGLLVLLLGGGIGAFFLIRGLRK